MGYQRKMKFESPSRMLSYQTLTNPAKIQLKKSTFKLIIQHVSISVFSNEHCCCRLRKYVHHDVMFNFSKLVFLVVKVQVQIPPKIPWNFGERTRNFVRL